MTSMVNEDRDKRLLTKSAFKDNPALISSTLIFVIFHERELEMGIHESAGVIRIPSHPDCE